MKQYCLMHAALTNNVDKYILVSRRKKFKTETFWHFICNFKCFVARPFSLAQFVHQKHMSRHTAKPTKSPVRPAKIKISLVIRPVCSVFGVRMKKFWVFSYPLSAQRRLIRLRGCVGWTESSLSARHFVGFVMLRLIWWKQVFRDRNQTTNSG